MVGCSCPTCGLIPGTVGSSTSTEETVLALETLGVPSKEADFSSIELSASCFKEFKLGTKAFLSFNESLEISLKRLVIIPCLRPKYLILTVSNSSLELELGTSFARDLKRSFICLLEIIDCNNSYLGVLCLETTRVP